MASEVGTGTLTADGTEQTLDTETTPGVYQAVIDLNAMVAGDVTEIRIYDKAISGGTSRLAFPVFTFDGAVNPAQWVTPPILVITEFKITLKQTAGTNRDYPWSLRKA